MLTFMIRVLHSLVILCHHTENIGVVGTTSVWTHVLLEIYDFIKKKKWVCFFDCELFSKDKAYENFHSRLH